MGSQPGDDHRESGFWSGIGTGCAGELGAWVLFVVGGGVASVVGAPWGWGVAVGTVLAVGVVLWTRRKR